MELRQTFNDLRPIRCKENFEEQDIWSNCKKWLRVKKPKKHKKNRDFGRVSNKLLEAGAEGRMTLNFSGRNVFNLGKFMCGVTDGKCSTGRHKANVNFGHSVKVVRTGEGLFGTMMKSGLGLGRGSDHFIASPKNTENPSEKLLFESPEQESRNSGFGGLLAILNNKKAHNITFDSPNTASPGKGRTGMLFKMGRLV